MNDRSRWVGQIVASVELQIAERAVRPQSTYRLQFHKDEMTFRRAAELVPYLDELGISHIYASPYQHARAGSPHGYAIVDYGSLNPELGSEQEFRDLVAALHWCGMGQVLDIVPNHMSTTPGENPWWTDVLENGPSSPYASSFDIDWDPVKDELKGRVLLPVLGEQYGETLESGHLRLEYREGAFFLRCYERLLPLDPRSYPLILKPRLEELAGALSAESPELLELESILTALEHLPDRNRAEPEAVRERQREKELIKKRLNALVQASPAVEDFIAAALAGLNGTPGDAASFDRLHALLDEQPYRLAHWKAAADEINYRRFFDVNELAAVSMEDPEVFARSHELVFGMLMRGDLDGVRVDHVDGLFDPTDYLGRLQQGYLLALAEQAYRVLAARQAETAETPPWEELEADVLSGLLEKLRGASPPLFVVVEKILGPEEPLPPQWPVAGTTGYDFLRAVNGLLVDWSGLDPLVKIFARFVGPMDYREVVSDSKLSILKAAMSSELHLLAHRLNRLSEHNRRFRDFTLNTLRHALREIIACFAVYRPYLRPQEVTERDRRFVLRAVAQAKRANPAIAPGAFDFVRDVLLFEQPASLDAEGRRQRELFVGRFQQVTSPVMAKGVEDTAFYRYFPLSSLNEVGDDPLGRPVTVEDFHRENITRQSDWPASLLCTTTHDTKRSEDVRARIDVLSEIPKEWGRMVNSWARLNRRHRRDVEGAPAPSRGDEYLIYQSLVGIWPCEPPCGEALREMVARLQAYMEKATREAKLRTSWLNPQAEYDAAVREFVAAVLDDHPKNRFLAEFRRFHQRIVRWGLYNALSQVVLKLTSPGVPDVYQGQELWDFSLVDPDNRRPVDFELRRRLLAELQSELSLGPPARLALARRLAENPSDLRLKLFVTWQTLRFRRKHFSIFRAGQYVPLAAAGARADHVCAFAWQFQPGPEQPYRHVVVVVPRLIVGLTPGASTENPSLPLGPAVWEDAHLIMPEPLGGPLWNVFTGQCCPVSGASLRLAEVLSDFPVAVLSEGEEAEG